MAEQAAEIEQDAEMTDGRPYDTGLLPALQRLDQLLERAVAAAQAAYGHEAAGDPFRGLHISQDDAERLLTRPPGAPILYIDGEEQEFPADASRLAWLARAFELSLFDLDIILIALAPEIDLRYERLYAYLQDDVARRRPSVDLALNLLCPSAEEKLAARRYFAPHAALLRHKLLYLDPPGGRADVPLLACTLRLDPQVVDVLLGQGELDRRLAACCRLIGSGAALDTLALDSELAHALAQLVAQSLDERRPLRLYFQGAPGSGRRTTAAALAAATGTRLLYADAALLGQSRRAEMLSLLFRETGLQGTLLYLDSCDVLRDDEQCWEQLLELLAMDQGTTVLAGARPWPPAGRTPSGTIAVPFGPLTAAQRRAHWKRALDGDGTHLTDDELDLVASRFQLSPAQIADAALAAQAYASLRHAHEARSEKSVLDSRPALPDLFAAARAQSGHDLAALARRVVPSCGWEDIVLPEDALAQLREICARATGRERVLGDWGFAHKLARGRGTSALFAGPAGTGKTMAAEIIAGELGLDLYSIDLAGVISKYIGETEKNLDRIFRAAEGANAVLFFDEADALFGKRSEVKDSHDRYANLEISYLLQKIEQYEGIAILATNLRQHLDEAFLRRLAFSVTFPFPDEAQRRRIWSVVWPTEAPLVDDVDLDFLAGRFNLSGGNIRNIALAAAYLASSDGGTITMAHLRHATRREYQKLGKALSDAELGTQS